MSSITLQTGRLRETPKVSISLHDTVEGKQLALLVDQSVSYHLWQMRRGSTNGEVYALKLDDVGASPSVLSIVTGHGQKCIESETNRPD